MALDFGLFSSKAKRGGGGRGGGGRYSDVPPTQKIDPPTDLDIGGDLDAVPPGVAATEPRDNQRAARLLAGAGLFFFLCAAVTVWFTARNAASEERQVALTGDMLMHTQRLAKAANGAVQGEPDQMDEMVESRDQVNADIELLLNGDPATGMGVSTGPIAVFLGVLRERWQTTYAAATVIASGRSALLGFGEIARRINQLGPRLGELTEGIAADKLRRGGSPREVATAEQLVSLHQRITKNANAIISNQAAHGDDAQVLGRDVQAFSDAVQSLLATTNDGDTRTRLQELQRDYKDLLNSVSAAVASPQTLVEARNAQITINAEAEPLRLQTVDLSNRYANQQRTRWLLYGLLALFSLAALAASENSASRP